MRAGLRTAFDRLLFRALPRLRRLFGLLEAAALRLDAETAANFDRLLEDAVARGGPIRYELAHPKHLFLRHLVSTRDVLLHGSNAAGIEEFRPRRQTDFYGRWTTGVFATSDGVWPLFFAVVARKRGESLRNGCMPRPDGRTLYYFSISADPEVGETWSDGAVYVLPRGPFRRVDDSPEWMSPRPVRPLAWLPVTPDDFPFRPAVFRHGRGESQLRFAWRLIRTHPPRPRVI